MQLPDAAHVRGFVFDSEGARLEGAEVKLFQVQTDLTVCNETRFAPQDCPIPALLHGSRRVRQGRRRPADAPR